MNGKAYKGTPEDRAMAAYWNRGPYHDIKQMPSAPERMTINGKIYIVLFNTTDLLAVYRLRNDGSLKRLKRWPGEINIYATEESNV